MSDDDRQDRVVDAFDAAVSWWHDQIDLNTGTGDDRPDTAREYFENSRGFDKQTLEEWRLGWAPPDGGLYDHLSGQGFDPDTIASTGLFCEKFPEKELWHGRYVMPYLSADGRADYAIARCTGDKGGGAAGYDGHDADFLAGKYAKVAHTRDDVPLSEPILGLHTLEDSDTVVVAEGIADAITATEAGYAALSPVTKEFKQEHFDVLVDAVRSHDIERVYVVPDAELAGFTEIDSADVPDEPDHIYEALNIPTVAPGPGGGLRTANYLVNQGIDARLVELPRPAADKVDLDDYLQNWSDTLYAGRACAKRPRDHLQYESATATQNTESKPDGKGESGDVSNPSETDGSSASRLFDLDVGDVNPSLTADYRGKNPLGHAGSSENYFVVNEHPDSGALIGKDYKRPGNPRYTGVTYLLVDLDERPVAGPMGPLSPRETWLAWAEARQRGLVSGDDVVPAPALEHIARKQELYGFKNHDSDDALPSKAHNRALWWISELWPESDGVELDLADDDQVTARSGQARDAGPTNCWEDVRYVYQEAKQKGRQAARQLLSDSYHFCTVADTDELMLYDEETGVYTTETGAIRGEIYDGLGEHWSTHELNEILAGLRQHDVVQPSELNGESLSGPHICVANGVLNLVTRKIVAHDPDHHFVDRVPVEYEPEADSSKHREFVDSLVRRDEDRQALFEMVGHALMPDANERYKKFLILTGDADNGKSVFFRRVKALLDGPKGEEQNTASVKLSKIAQNKFSMDSVYGAKANIAGEIDGKRIRNTANLKDVTGGDVIEIEPKGQASFFDTINTTLMFAANDPPIIGKRDKEAIRSRIVPVELPYTFVDEPSKPLEKLARPERELSDELDTSEALSGLLNLALDGIERLEKNHGDVSLPESPSERLQMYERTADPMREFGERCLTNDPDSYIVKADITTMYREFARDNDYAMGQSVHSVLHNVLRGVPTLNYTQSRPREPDYTDTELPLRGWDERKNVVDRLALTDEGLEYAESAGIVQEKAGKPGSDGSNPTHQAIGSLSTGRGVAFTAEIVTVSDGEYNRVAQGELEGEIGTRLGFVIPGSNEHVFAGKQGKTVRLSQATIRTDEDGLKEVVVNDATGVEFVGPQGSAQESVTAATTDGGSHVTDADATDGATEAPTDGAAADADADTAGDTDASDDTTDDARNDVQLKKKVIDELRQNDYVTDESETVYLPRLAGSLHAEPDSVETVLSDLASEGRLLTQTGGDYQLL